MACHYAVYKHVFCTPPHNWFVPCLVGAIWHVLLTWQLVKAMAMSQKPHVNTCVQQV